MTFHDEGYDNAQHAHDNESPPEVEYCDECGEDVVYCECAHGNGNGGEPI